MAKLKIGLVDASPEYGRRYQALMHEAALIAVDDINASGGVLGNQIEPIRIESEPGTNSLRDRVADTLREHQLSAIFAGGSSASRQAIQQAIAENPRPVLFFNAAPHEGLESAHLTLYTGPCANQLAQTILQWCAQAGYQRLFVLQADSVFAQLSVELLRALAPMQGVNIAGTALHGDTSDDFPASLQTAHECNADLLINLLPSEIGAGLFRSLNQHQPLPCLSTWVFQPDLAELRDQPADHLLCAEFLQPTPTLPAHKRLDAALRNRLGTTASLCDPALRAYRQLYLWHELVAHQGSLDPEALYQSATDHAFDVAGSTRRLNQQHHAYNRLGIARIDPAAGLSLLWQPDEEMEPLPWMGLEALPEDRTLIARRVLARLPAMLSHARDAERKAVQQTGQLSHSLRALEEEMQKREALETRLQYDANFDTLTGLPNQRKFITGLQALLDRPASAGSLALCLVNLDGFRAINARHGKDVGDHALLKLAQRLAEFLPSGSLLARWGGDEFIFTLRDGDYDAKLRDILELLKAPITLNQTRLSIGASIGANLCQPHPGSPAENLVRQASHAMYRAKRHGGSHILWFDHALERALQLNTQKQLDIRQAIRDGRLRLFYQPKVDMRTQRILGAEALVRCIGRNEDELIGPGEFLPFLVGSAVEQELDWWVLDTAMAQARAWQQIHPDFILSVNVNPQTLMQEHFVSRLQALSVKHGIQTRHFELEILESSEIADLANINALIQRARELGFRFALDDCGAGYSSLAFIRWLKVDTLKIDQSFVRNLESHSEDTQLVKGLIGLAQAFERDIVAEGVASIALGRILIELGCHKAQGFGIARPMPARALEQWVNEYRFPTEWRDV